MARKKPLVPIPKFSVAQIESALKNNGGHLSFAAAELQCPVEELKKYILKFKSLRNTLFNVREAAVDLAEDTLLWRIKEKKDLIASMFLLKCLGKERGWIDRPDKAGSSLEKPIYIKIMPVDGNGKSGKDFAEIKIGKSEKKAISGAVLPDNAEDIIDAEVIDEI